MSSAISRVAVTGAAGYVGRQLIKRLERHNRIERILALDIRQSASRQFSSKVEFHQHDVTHSMADLLAQHGIEAIAHLAFILNPGRSRTAVQNVNIGGTASVLDACVRAGVRHLLCLSSTTIYGAHPDNPPELTEESPMRPNSGFQYAESKVAVELLLKDFAKRHPEITLSVLRSCPVMGPNADNFISRAFSRSFLVGVKGCDPPMQFLHEDDLTDVLAVCLLDRVCGIYNIGGHGGIAWSEMAEIAGRRLVYLPAPLLYGLTGLSWDLRLQGESPACGLDFIRYRWIADTEKIQREQGIRMRYSSREAWEAFISRRRLSPVEGASQQ